MRRAKMYILKTILALLVSTLLVLGSSVAFATMPKRPPRHMTIGLLQIFCIKDAKSEDRLNVFGNGYCEGYLTGLIDSYFANVARKRTSYKRNFCVLFPSNNSLRDEIRDEIAVISEGRILSLDYGTPAESWVKDRLADKCESKK